MHVRLVSYLGNLWCLGNNDFINFPRVPKLSLSSLQTYILSWVFLKLKSFLKRELTTLIWGNITVIHATYTQIILNSTQHTSKIKMKKIEKREITKN